MASITNMFADLKIPLEDIIKATNNFADENIIGHGDFGKVYKGQLWQSKEEIVARRLDRKHGQGHVEFWTEIAALSSLKHKNLISLIGFCDENGEKIIVIKDEAGKQSLSMHLSDPTLTWIQRLNICVGVARALRYIHSGEGLGYIFIHRNINSTTILLDDNWVPKLSGFEFSIRQPVNRKDQIRISEAIGTTGYMDPEILKTGGVTYKSDIYAFGVVLCEILCGRKAFIPNVDVDNRFLAPLFRKYYDNRTLNEIIHPDLRYQMAQRSLTRFSKAAHSCLEEQLQRPNMNDIVNELEKALKLQQPLEDLRKKVEHLEHLKIPLNDIKLATDNFSDASRIKYTGYYNLYKAEIEHFVKGNLSIKEGNTRRGTVVIKRIIPVEEQEEYKERGFYTEIQMLAACNHPNILKLLGFCDQDSEMILVIEHLSNGYLADYWYNTNGMRHILTWEKRLNICLDVANALHYIHSEMEDQKMIIHRDIQSLHIVLDENWGAKIIDFGLSVFLPPNEDDDALHPKSTLGDHLYMDPEYSETGKLKRESDVYSFGVVLFEVLFGKSARDHIYDKERLVIVARRCFQQGTLLTEMMDPMLKEESGINSFSLNRGPNKDSLDKFVKIAHQCVAQTQDQRPTMKVVVEELKKALFFQENNNDNPKILLEEIKLATQNFHEDNCVGAGGFGKVYRGQLRQGDGYNTIVAKRLDTSHGQGKQQFGNEIQILLAYKNDNIIRLVGYCVEEDENILVYEYVSRGSLDRYLKDDRLTWMNRLKICIDVATALAFLHGGAEKQAKVIHRDIKTANILVNDEWKAKLADFGLSLISPINQATDYVIEHACGTRGYLDPLYLTSGLLTIESDIYSFGVVLFEILCGRSTYEIRKEKRQFLPGFIKESFEKGKTDDLVFEAIKEQIVPRSLTAFLQIAYQCLHDDRIQRPTAKEVLLQLKEALDFQRDQIAQKPSSQRMFTQAEVDDMFAARLANERAK